MKSFAETTSFVIAALSAVAAYSQSNSSAVQPPDDLRAGMVSTLSSRSAENGIPDPESPNYRAVQKRLARGWNTWDVHSVTTQVLLPDGLAIRVGVQHNTTEGGDAFLSNALIGRQTPGAEEVFPGPHSWDGSYTDLRLSFKGHNVRIQSAHQDKDIVILATPLPSEATSTLCRRAHFLQTIFGTDRER
jgi:hypothetical protein